MKRKDFVLTALSAPGLAALAAGLLALVTAAPARAELVTGAELTAPFAVTHSDRSPTPSVLGEAALYWKPAGSRLAGGLLVGQRLDAFLSPVAFFSERTEANSLLGGASLQYWLGPSSWSVHPYLQGSVGMAHTTLRHERLSPVTEREHVDVNGVFLAPGVGLRAALTSNLELRVAFRYHHVLAGRTVRLVEDRWGRHLAGAGLGAGLFVRL